MYIGQLVVDALATNCAAEFLVLYTAQSSLVPRPPCPAFVTCSTKVGRRPGQIYHVMRATADIMFSLLTSRFVLSPSLFFP